MSEGYQQISEILQIEVDGCTAISGDDMQYSFDCVRWYDIPSLGVMLPADAKVYFRAAPA